MSWRYQVWRWEISHFLSVFICLLHEWALVGVISIELHYVGLHFPLCDVECVSSGDVIYCRFNVRILRRRRWLDASIWAFPSNERMVGEFCGWHRRSIISRIRVVFDWFPYFAFPCRLPLLQCSSIRKPRYHAKTVGWLTCNRMFLVSQLNAFPYVDINVWWHVVVWHRDFVLPLAWVFKRAYLIVMCGGIYGVATFLLG